MGRGVYDGSIYWDYEALRRMQDLLCFRQYVVQEVEGLLAEAYIRAIEQLDKFKRGHIDLPKKFQ